MQLCTDFELRIRPQFKLCDGLFFIFPAILYYLLLKSRTISSATNSEDSVLTIDSRSSTVVDVTSSFVEIDSCNASPSFSIVTVTDRDVSKPAMAVLHTISPPANERAEAVYDSSDIQKHPEQVDASSEELGILHAESVAAAAAVAAADVRLRFLRARRTSVQASQASARSTIFALEPVVRPLWLPAAEELPDRGPLATVSRAPPAVRRAAEPAHRAAFRQQEGREKKWEKERRDRER